MLTSGWCLIRKSSNCIIKAYNQNMVENNESWIWSIKDEINPFGFDGPLSK
jgi:hypothetical protein